MIFETEDEAQQVRDLGYQMDRANAHFDGMGKLERHHLRRIYETKSRVTDGTHVSHEDNCFFATPIANILKEMYGTRCL